MKQTAKQSIERYTKLKGWINVLTAFAAQQDTSPSDVITESYNQLIKDMECECESIKAQLSKRGITL